MNTNLMNRNSNNEMKSNKSSIFEKNKNKNELKRINGDNIILNANKNINSGDDKKVYFNIKLDLTFFHILIKNQLLIL